MSIARIRLVFLLLVLSQALFAPQTRAAAPTDSMRLIELTTTLVAKQVPSGTTVHVTKMSLNESYAIVQWTAGQRQGQELFQKRYAIGWTPLGAGGQVSAGWLVDDGVPPASATALIAGIRHCTNPEPVTYHGLVTSVCTIGPCGVC